MGNKLKMAQDVLRPGGRGYGGFNSRVLGWTFKERFSYPAYVNPEEVAGFELADKMILEGKIYSVHRFRHRWGDVVCEGRAFPYGGTWVCNTCERSDVAEDWWQIKVYKDGNAWCCVGPDFEDLQASSDYAFGATRDEAIKAYEDLMLKASDLKKEGV